MLYSYVFTLVLPQRCKYFFECHRTRLHSGVDSRISTQTEFSARDIVADGGRNDTHGNTQLVVAPPGIIQFQNPFISLKNKRALGFDHQSYMVSQ